MNRKEERNLVLWHKSGLAVWAARDSDFHPNDSLERRTRFKHDEDEIIYSRAFRRLSHKSQIIVKPERRDHFRSRLTHTLEVNQIAESISNRLGLNTSLVNAIAMGHDLGHSPFGHAGEFECQEIMSAEILPDCQVPQLLAALEKEYRCPLQAIKNEQGMPKRHWLFHHAINSIRVIQRKTKEVTPETQRGVLTHSWSPWQQKHEVKFGLPDTFEAQAVAIADQIAGINHDTEDILSCQESKHAFSPEHGVNTLRDRVSTYLQTNSYLQFNEATKMFDDWFLPPEASAADGFSRRKRLQYIINSVVQSSLTHWKFRKINSPDAAHQEDNALGLEDALALFLRGYERYLREEIIQKVSWFRNRDAIARAVVRTTYNFFKHYSDEDSSETGLAPEAQSLIAAYGTAIHEDNGRYNEDRHMQILKQAAIPEHARRLESAVKALDYVAGMTDRYITEVYKIAFDLFR